MFETSAWQRFKFIYESTGQDEILHGFCHLLVEYMHFYLMGTGSNITMVRYEMTYSLIHHLVEYMHFYLMGTGSNITMVRYEMPYSHLLVDYIGFYDGPVTSCSVYPNRTFNPSICL